ncbi:MAG: CHAT domain-containing protein, partial [Bacteroidetes bacterium]|nr:CHAT domain-containing protein [Bacteroidota bacterium]
QPVQSEGGKGRLYAGIAPEYHIEDENEIKDIFSMRSGLSPDRFSFSHLPNSGPEVAGAEELLGGKVWLGERGTEKRFKEEIAGNYQILHLATHAWVNDENPLYSGLLFAVDSANLKNGDTLSSNEGLLYAYELYQMQFEADLAVLSACETGKGRLLKGEGMMNLARAFRYAGCKNILMSLWRANDASTRELMSRYFQHLADGKGKAESLRQAKLEMISQSSWKHPFYWAGFVLIGDDEPVKNSSKWWMWGGGIALILILGGILFFRKR